MLERMPEDMLEDMSDNILEKIGQRQSTRMNIGKYVGKNANMDGYVAKHWNGRKYAIEKFIKLQKERGEVRYL